MVVVTASVVNVGATVVDVGWLLMVAKVVFDAPIVVVVSDIDVITASVVDIDAKVEDI